MKLLLTTIKSNVLSSKLSIKYLYSVVEAAPIDSVAREFDTLELDVDIYDQIVSEQYDIVYFHCDEENVQRIMVLAEMVKKALRQVIIIAGGIELSFDSKQIMLKNPSLDFIVRGEGEIVFYNLIKSFITHDNDYANIPGLCYREDGSINVNPFAEQMPMDDLPFPYEKTEIDKLDTVYYESFRGTADTCTYSQFLPDTRVRPLPLNRICTELRYFLVKSVPRVVFIEKWFNINPDRAYRIFEYIINNDNGETVFTFDINGDYLDEDCLRLLSTVRPGLFEFNIDIESTNPETLDAVGRKDNIYQLLFNISQLIQNNNIKTNVYITAGLPFETKELFARSFNKVFGLSANTIKIRPLRLLKGTKLRTDVNRYGYQFNSNAPYEVIANETMPATDLIEVKTVAKTADIYLANGGFEKSIQRIINDTNIKPFDLFDSLSRYIRENNFQVKMNLPENLYRILYAFAIKLYDKLNDTLKLQILMETIHSELEENFSSDVVKRFDKKGWEIDAR